LAASSFAQTTICGRLIFGENFSRNGQADSAAPLEPRGLFRVFWNSTCDFPVSKSGLHPEMSLEFEYRRLAAACLDLAKRSTIVADKTRLLLIAEAWIDLAERVTRKNGNVKRHDMSGARPKAT